MKREKALQKLEQDIKLRGLAESTRKSYVSYTKEFLNYCDRPIDKLKVKHIRKFLTYLNEERHLANQTVNGYGCAVRFFFAVTLDQTMNYLQIPRMKVPKYLPTILTRDEVSKLVAGSANAKDKAMILLAYGSGLRASEVAALRVTDIQSKTMRVFVHKGKRNKDRYTILSENTLQALRDYWHTFRPKRSENWLFPGANSGSHVTSRVVENAIKTASSNTSIAKDITPHTLRHAFATHMVEDGANLLQVKELLGHSSIQSTVIYLHLANNSDGTVSPADRLAGELND